MAAGSISCANFLDSHGLRGIALSGFGMDSDLAQSTAAGFSRHLIKPIDIATLRATIAEMTSGA